MKYLINYLSRHSFPLFKISTFTYGKKIELAFKNLEILRSSNQRFKNANNGWAAFIAFCIRTF